MLEDEHIFTKKDKGLLTASSIKSGKEAIDIALGFEKESIKFYEGMKKVVMDKESKGIDQLILEENDHVKKLTDIKSRAS